MSERRKIPSAKRYEMKNVLDFQMLVPQFDDLENHELESHFRKAIADQDFEYAQAAYAEALARGLKIKFE